MGNVKNLEEAGMHVPHLNTSIEGNHSRNPRSSAHLKEASEKAGRTGECDQMDQDRGTMAEQIRLLDELIEMANSSLMVKPEGGLSIYRNRGTLQYYHRDKANIHGHYIRKKDTDLITALAQKDYDSRFLKRAKELRWESETLYRRGAERSIHTFYSSLAQVYEELSEARQKLVKPYVLSDNQYIKVWEDIPYCGKGFAEDAPEIYSEKGERVRSKSEKMIADKLLLMNIPYRYEYPFLLDNGRAVFPDFTLLHVSERREIVFEHFGLMQDADYCNLAIHKMEAYRKSGLVIGRDIFYTFETPEHPLDMRHFERILLDIIK